jgi:hypothetical protein
VSERRSFCTCKLLLDVLACLFLLPRLRERDGCISAQTIDYYSFLAYDDYNTLFSFLLLDCTLRNGRTVASVMVVDLLVLSWDEGWDAKIWG